MTKKINDTIEPLTLTSIQDQNVTIPKPDKLIHLQFRRFAGCPVCNLHLQSFLSRADELTAHNIHEVVIFHASKTKMLEKVVDVPFDLIADPHKELYKAFGVQGTWKALLNGGTIKSALKGAKQFGVATPEKLESEFIVPADFLISSEGRILASHYGTHANDQWSVDEVIKLASRH